MTPPNRTLPILALILFSACASASEKTPQEKAWTILQDGVNEKNVERRTRAVLALGLIRNNSRAAGMAEKALARDKKPEVRAAGAEALGLMGSKASIPNLQQALSDKEPSVALEAAHSLVDHLQNKSGYEVFYAILSGKRKSGEGLVAEQMHVLEDPKKMAMLGFEQGIGFIPFADIGYSAIRALTKDDVSPVRAAAAESLADDPDPQSAEALVRAASDKKWIVRAAAVDAIAMRNNPALLDSVLTAMSDPKGVVRYTAAAAVLRLSALAKAPKPRPKPRAKPKT